MTEWLTGRMDEQKHALPNKCTDKKYMIMQMYALHI